MSSKNNPKRIRNIHGHPIIINVESTKPTNAQVADEGEKADTNPLSSLWNIIGASSIVTAILFMIGWAYVSNWYAYFGVDIVQLDISPQDVLIHSLQPALWILVAFILSFMFYVVSIFLLQVSSPLDRGDFEPTFQKTSIENMLIISILTLAFVSGVQIFGYLGLGFEVGNLPPESFISFFIGIALLGVILIFTVGIIVNSWVHKENLKSLLKRYWLALNPYMKTLSISIVPLSIIIAISFSAYLAISDASAGFKALGEPIQKVFLVAPKQLDSIQEVQLASGNDHNFVYGPFGLIMESQDSFYLIKWAETKREFKQFPGLFIMPRDDYFVVPASVAIPTVILQPIPTTTIMPTPIITTTPIPTQP